MLLLLKVHLVTSPDALWVACSAQRYKFALCCCCKCIKNYAQDSSKQDNAGVSCNGLQTELASFVACDPGQPAQLAHNIPRRYPMQITLNAGAHELVSSHDQL